MGAMERDSVDRQVGDLPYGPVKRSAGWQLLLDEGSRCGQSRRQVLCPTLSVLLLSFSAR